LYNIAILLGTFVGGGIERAVLTFLQGLDSSLFSPYIICYSKCGSLAPMFESLNFPIYVVPLHSWNMPSVILNVYRYIVKNRIDLIHSHAYHADVVARLAAHYANIPIVNTLHTNSRWKRQPCSISQYVQRFFDQYTAKNYGVGFIALSKSIRTFHVEQLGYPSEVWRIISNPVDFSRLNNKTDDRFVIRRKLGIRSDQIVVIAVGNLLPVKGHAFLLDALPLISSEYFKKIRVIIAGEGSERAHLESKIKKLHLQKVVSLLGYREDLGSLLAASDIFAMPSLSEGQSVAILEAMAMKLPLIVTSQGSHCDFLEHDKNALIAEPSNSKQLAILLEYLIKKPDEMIRLKRSAFVTFQNLSIFSSIEKQQEFYCDVINKYKFK